MSIDDVASQLLAAISFEPKPVSQILHDAFGDAADEVAMATINGGTITRVRVCDELDYKITTSDIHRARSLLSRLKEMEERK